MVFILAGGARRRPLTSALGVMAMVASVAAVAAPATAGSPEGRALVFEGDDRCYVYRGSTGVEYWAETNAILLGGVPMPWGGGSGLQRARVGTLPPDLKLASLAAWRERCWPDATQPPMPVLPDASELDPGPGPDPQPFCRIAWETDYACSWVSAYASYPCYLVWATLLGHSYFLAEAWRLQCNEVLYGLCTMIGSDYCYYY